MFYKIECQKVLGHHEDGKFRSVVLQKKGLKSVFNSHTVEVQNPLGVYAA